MFFRLAYQLWVAVFAKMLYIVNQTESRERVKTHPTRGSKHVTFSRHWNYSSLPLKSHPNVTKIKKTVHYVVILIVATSKMECIHGWLIKIKLSETIYIKRNTENITYKGRRLEIVGKQSSVEVHWVSVQGRLESRADGEVGALCRVHNVPLGRGKQCLN